jgi:putative peptide zinc metalloprotease protein
MIDLLHVRALSVNDNDGGDHLYSVAVGDGVDRVYLRLSWMASVIVESRRAGRSFEYIASELSRPGVGVVSASDAEAAYRQTLDRIGRIREGWRPTSREYWFRVRLLSAHLVDRLASRLGWLFGASGLLVWSASIVGTVALLWINSDLLYMPIGHAALPAGLLFFFLSAVFHELGHATACRRYGLSPPAIGFTVYLIFPALYVDATESWKLTRSQRIVVNLAGVYFHVMAASVFIGLWAVTGSQSFFAAVLMIAVATLWNLNPFLKTDGYWVISDIVDVPNLSRAAFKMLKLYVSSKPEGAIESLGWSGGKAAFLRVYAVLSVAFMGWFLTHLIAVILKNYLIFSSDVFSEGFSGVGSFLSTSFAVVSLIWLASRLIGGLRSVVRR